MAAAPGSLRPYVLSAGLSVLAATLLVGALLRPFRVAGRSMAPTLSDGSVVLVDRTAFLWRSPRRGEVVVFRTPGWGLAVKRVVALPGDRVVFSDGGVAVNGRPVPPFASPPGQGREREVTVPPGAFFCVGDNLLESLDSRRTGPVPGELLVGRVVLAAAAPWVQGSLSPAAAGGPGTLAGRNP
ncbi:MAG: signal peptidase I [Acidobacteriota bacterium]